MNFFLDLPLVHTYIYLLHEQLILKAHIDKLLHLSMHWFNVCRFYRLLTNFVNVCRWYFFHICRWFLKFVRKIFHVSTFVDVLTFVVSSNVPISPVQTCGKISTNYKIHKLRSHITATTSESYAATEVNLENSQYTTCRSYTTTTTGGHEFPAYWMDATIPLQPSNVPPVEHDEPTLTHSGLSSEVRSPAGSYSLHDCPSFG